MTRTLPILFITLTLGLMACDKDTTAPKAQKGAKSSATQAQPPSAATDDGGPDFIISRADLKKKRKGKKMCELLLDEAAAQRAFGHPVKPSKRQMFSSACLFEAPAIDLTAMVKVSAQRDKKRAQNIFRRSTAGVSAEAANEVQKNFAKSVGGELAKQQREGKVSEDTAKGAGKLAEAISKGASSKSGGSGFKIPKQLETVRDSVDLGPRAVLMTSYSMQNGKKVADHVLHMQEGNLNTRITFTNLAEGQKAKALPILVDSIRKRLNTL